MQIRRVKHKSTAMKDFSKKEWAIADTKHFGRPSRWHEKDFYIKVLDQGKIVGMLHYSIKAGVVEIITLIVSHEKRKKGIGVALIKKVEQLAKKEKAHKLYLITGKGWESEDFYKKMGFTKTGELEKHLLKIDWIEYSKFL
jgi:N-acetylglutamate synthase-like GNAT family acetyltransferase